RRTSACTCTSSGTSASRSSRTSLCHSGRPAAEQNQANRGGADSTEGRGGKLRTGAAWRPSWFFSAVLRALRSSGVGSGSSLAAELRAQRGVLLRDACGLFLAPARVAQREAGIGEREDARGEERRVDRTAGAGTHGRDRHAAGHLHGREQR